MKRTLLLISCFSIMSNCYALKSNIATTSAATSSSVSGSVKKYLQSRMGPDTKGRVYTTISTYNKKDATEVANLATEIANFVYSSWASYNIDKNDLIQKIKEAAPQYLKKWKRHYLYVYAPAKSNIESYNSAKVAAKVNKLFKSDSSGLNGRIWNVSNNTAGEKDEYIVEMAAKNNIFKSTGKNLTFHIYKGHAE